MTVADVRAEFLRLHQSGCFVMPNVARRRERPAASPRSARPRSPPRAPGFAATLGQARHDGDAPPAGRARARGGRRGGRCRSASTPSGASPTTPRAWPRRSSCSPRPVPPDARSRTGTRSPGASIPIDDAVARVAAAAGVARTHGMVLTARCEHHIRGVDDLDGTVRRLAAYHEAGAEAVFAPGIRDLDSVRAIVAIGAPVSVLVLPGSPSVAGAGRGRGAPDLGRRDAHLDDVRRAGRQRPPPARARHARPVAPAGRPGADAARVRLIRPSARSEQADQGGQADDHDHDPQRPWVEAAPERSRRSGRRRSNRRRCTRRPPSRRGSRRRTRSRRRGSPSSRARSSSR